MFEPEAPWPWKTKPGNSKLDDDISRVLMDKAAGRRNSVGRDGQILVGNEGSDKLRSEKNETTLAA